MSSAAVAVEDMSSNRYYKVAGVLVEEKMFSESFICDSKRFACASACCKRGGLMFVHEVENIKKHWNTVKKYLGPEKQNFNLDSGENTFYEACQPNCPCGFTLGAEEVKYLQAHVARGGKTQFYCTKNDGDICTFAYSDRGELRCALHAAALELELPLNELKPLDCIQFPIAILKEGEVTRLVFQQVEQFKHLPCLNQKSSRKMYQDMKDSIVALLGKNFYEKLVIFAERLQKGETDVAMVSMTG